MTERSTIHPRQSQWRVFERCLALLMRLMRSPAKSSELLEIVSNMAEEDSEFPERSALEKRFEEDRRRLKNWFQCEWDYDRREDTYIFISIDRAMLDMSDRALRGLAFLQSTFNDHNVPMGEEVQAVIDTILMVIPTKRQRDLAHERGLLEVDLQPRDRDTIPEEVWDAVRRSCGEHRQLEFENFSPSQSDGIPRLHLVEPQRYFFDPAKGHYYLEAYCIETSGPFGRRAQGKIQRYRLGRIAHPRVLPTKFLLGGRVLNKHELVYELTSQIARQGVTEYFPNSMITRHPDGSATVRAVSTNLFFDLRTLLHYGPNCRVVGGDEALHEMQKIVQAMCELYNSTQSFQNK